MLAMLPSSIFAPCANMFPLDNVIAHPPPDFLLELVPSVAIIIGISLKTFWNNCFFQGLS